MELLLVKLAALARPLASMEFGSNLFAVAGMALFGLLVLGLLVHLAVRASLRMSDVDLIIVAFTVWCIAVSLIYLESVRIAEVAKLLIPLLSYTLVKNVVRNTQEYRSVVWWMLVGFSLPTALSAVLIAGGHPLAIDMVNYWSGVTRWDGVYNHSHTLGHSMTLVLMTIVLWMTLCKYAPDREVVRIATSGKIFVGALGVLALYCLAMSQVRSALMGLLIFIAVYLFYFNRRLLVVGAVGLAILVVLTVPYWLPAMMPEISARERGLEVTAMDMGSGRPRLWLNDLTVFGLLPLDQKLGGVGIGAEQVGGGEAALYGHNDWLQLLTQTGLVGFGLYAALQVLILRKILSVSGQERYVFLALFVAVMLMMFVSNSYAWRIQVSQLYYMLLAYIEIPTVQAEPRVVAMRRATS